MTRRGDAGELGGRVAEAVYRLRREGAIWRHRAEVERGEDVEPPLGGWAPILDDEGNVHAEPAPREPTDAPHPPDDR